VDSWRGCSVGRRDFVGQQRGDKSTPAVATYTTAAPAPITQQPAAPAPTTTQAPTTTTSAASSYVTTETPPAAQFCVFKGVPKPRRYYPSGAAGVAPTQRRHLDRPRPVHSYHRPSPRIAAHVLISPSLLRPAEVEQTAARLGLTKRPPQHSVRTHLTQTRRHFRVLHARVRGKVRLFKLSGPSLIRVNRNGGPRR